MHPRDDLIAQQRRQLMTYKAISQHHGIGITRIRRILQRRARREGMPINHYHQMLLAARATEIEKRNQQMRIDLHYSMPYVDIGKKHGLSVSQVRKEITWGR